MTDADKIAEIYDSLTKQFSKARLVHWAPIAGATHTNMKSLAASIRPNVLYQLVQAGRVLGRRLERA